jgi:hypothetical protein
VVDMEKVVVDHTIKLEKEITNVDAEEEEEDTMIAAEEEEVEMEVELILDQDLKTKMVMLTWTKEQKKEAPLKDTPRMEVVRHLGVAIETLGEVEEEEEEGIVLVVVWLWIGMPAVP